MTEFELRPARLYHCGRMIRKLRAAQAGALATLGIHLHTELRARFSESSYKESWFIDRKLAALGGVTGSLMSSTGFIWLAVSDDATRYPRQLALMIRTLLARVMETRHEVYTVIFKEDIVSLRWVEFLRFHEAKTQPDWLPDGAVLMRHGKGRA